MFKRYQQIHFVGIGGAGMSGIAEILLNLGYRVTGSDQRRNEAVERLEALGAKVFIGHEAGHVEGAHVVVYSSAVSRDNVEVQVARQRAVPTIPTAPSRRSARRSSASSTRCPSTAPRSSASTSPTFRCSFRESRSGSSRTASSRAPTWSHAGSPSAG